MAGRPTWAPPAFAASELDRHLLRLCAPVATLPPLWVHPEKLLERAVALDLFPLAFHRLRRSPRWLPEKTSPQWEERFRANAARCMLLESEQQRLLAALAAAGVRGVPLKGTRLAELAYGDLVLRAQADIDLYVPPRQLGTAAAVLESNGAARLAHTELAPERLAATGDEFTSECPWQLTPAGVPVLLELHWRLLPLSDTELENALVPDKAGHRLPSELNLLYLCLQASADRWGTLKTLTDLAHWLHREPPDWERVVATAGHLGLRRVLYITVAVLLNYFHLTVPESVLRRLDGARPPKLPAAAVANPWAPQTALSPAATHRFRWQMRERFRDRLGYAAYLLRPTPSDLEVLSVPPSLNFLSWGVRWLRVSGLLNGAGARPPAAVPE